MEDELQDRVTFRVFCGMYQDENFPDHSTLCNFRNDLVDADMLKVMFDEINAQLEVQNLKIYKGEIVILDSTLVQSATRPLKKSNEEETQEVSTAKGAEQKNENSLIFRLNRTDFD